MKVTCPHCHVGIDIRVTLTPLDDTGTPASGGKSSDRRIHKALREFLAMYDPGRIPSAHLWNHYQDEAGQEWPELTEGVFFRALGKLGLEQYRTPTERGWIVTEDFTNVVPSELLPPAPSPTAPPRDSLVLGGEDYDENGNFVSPF